MPKKKKKEKAPTYERPEPWLSAARGRLGKAPTKADGQRDSPMEYIDRSIVSFCGVTHGPGWMDGPKAPVIKDTDDGKKGKKGKKNAPKAANLRPNSCDSWNNFEKSHLLNTYLANLPMPPWSKGTPSVERPMTVWPLKYRNADKAVCQQGCGQPGLTKKQRLRHEVEECEYRPVRCPAGCAAENLTPATIQEHLESDCNYRPDWCQYECGHCEATGTLPQHELACLHRPADCSLGCGIYGLIIKTKRAHERTECPNREVPCPDCQQIMVWKTLDAHRDLLCANRMAGPCQWCGEEGLRLPEHAIHEKSQCKMRPVECKFNCGIEGLQGWREERHYKSCPERTYTCERCSQMVRGDDQPAHDGRYLYGRVPVCKNLSVYCKQGCGDFMPFDQITKHIEEDCGRTMVPCPIGCKGVKKVLGGDPITYVNKFRRNEIDKHCADECPQRDVNCYHYPGCKYAMKAHERDAHCANECAERIVECPKCDISTLKAREVRRHENMHSKENAAEDAKKALFEQSLIRVEKEPCPKCKKGVLPRELQWHLKKDCSHRLKVISNKVGAASQARAQDCMDISMRGRLPPVELPYHPVVSAKFNDPLPLNTSNIG